MKIVLLCSRQPNHIALANKVAAAFNLVGVVVEEKAVGLKVKKNAGYYFNKILDRTLFYPITNTWKKLMAFYSSKYPKLPGCDSIAVKKINSPETIEFIKKHQPDVVMVSGTSLIRQAILDIDLPIGVVNMHTGLSPYVKGGPNCTNWCFSTGTYHLIGNTLMWIDKGIDTGDVIATELTPLTGNESYYEVHVKVMEHAHDLYLRGLKHLQQNGGAAKRVPQKEITGGTTYYTKMWSFTPKLNLLKNLIGDDFKKAVQSKAYSEQVKILKTYPLINE